MKLPIRRDTLRLVGVGGGLVTCAFLALASCKKNEPIDEAKAAVCGQLGGLGDEVCLVVVVHDLDDDVSLEAEQTQPNEMEFSEVLPACSP